MSKLGLNPELGGTIFEKTVGTNWTTYKYTNGLMIETMNYDYAVPVTNTWGNAYSSGNKSLPDFDVSFYEMPVVVKTIMATSYDGWLATSADYKPSATNPGGYQIIRGTSNSNTKGVLSVVAIGRWK